MQPQLPRKTYASPLSPPPASARGGAHFVDSRSRRDYTQRKSSQPSRFGTMGLCRSGLSPLWPREVPVARSCRTRDSGDGSRWANVCPVGLRSRIAVAEGDARMVMKYLDLSLSTPAENLALDEALLDEAEQGRGPAEVLRLWEPLEPFVVVGRSSRLAVEVDMESCRAARTPVLRRCSGGAAVVTGPGCLMYAVVLSYAPTGFAESGTSPLFCAGNDGPSPLDTRPGCRDVGDQRLGAAGPEVLRQQPAMPAGPSALSRHGALPLPTGTDRALPADASAPARLSPAAGSRRLCRQFPGHGRPAASRDSRNVGAHEELTAWPRQRTDALVAERYARADWNARL